MKRLRIARDGYILMSIIFYIAGLVYMFWSKISPTAVCIISGIILIFYGGIKIIGYFSDDLYCLAFQYGLGCGLFLIILGIIVLGCNLRIQQYLSPGLGLLILMDSLLTIQMSKDAKKFGVESWYIIFVLSAIVGVFGVLIVIKPFPEIRVSHIIGGCGLLAEGVMNHIVVKETVKIMHGHSLSDKNERSTEE